MDFLVLLALLALAVPVGVVVLFVLVIGLRDRVGALEREANILRQRLLDVERRGVLPPTGRAPVDDPVSGETQPAAATAVALPPPSQPSAPVMAALPAVEQGGGAVPPVPPTVPPPASPLFAWLRENWVYVVAGLSLAAAGVFLVQYGMERGWLPPVMRVLAALAFGAALVAAGEVIRRKGGDTPDRTTAYIPSAFAAAGIVSILAAVLSARFLYALVGPEVTFAALFATALGAMVLGWLMGPLLAALGLLGAAAAPFLTGGGSQAPDWLALHYVLVAGLGLGIDTLRRWGWVSVLALALAFGGGWLLMLAGLSQAAYAGLVAALVPLAIAIPARGLIPDQSGPSMVEVAQGLAKVAPFPVMLAAGVTLAATLALVTQSFADAGTAQLALLLLAGLAILLLVWPDRAPALQELALIPAAGLLLKALWEATGFGPLHGEFVDAAIALRPPETAPPLSVTVLIALSLLVSAMLVWRARRGTVFAGLMTMAAAALPAGMAVLAEVMWHPAAVLGAYPWALHVMAAAAVVTGLALAMARTEGEDRAGTAHLALSALLLVALALFIVLSDAALTLALSLLVVAAAALDRRFRLPEMGLAVQAGLAVIFYRLVVDPGVFWAFDAPLFAALLSHIGPAAAALAALWLLRDLPRPATQAALESAAVIAPALLADVLILRWLDGTASFHALVVALGLPWLLVALGQLWRAAPGLPMRRMRLVLAGLALVPAALSVLAAISLLNPLLTGDPVAGPPLLNTLALAYAVPAALLLAARGRIGWLPLRMRQGMLAAGGALLALYAGLAIRHIWQGPDLSRPGTTDGELYTYTVALILLGAALLWQAIARGSPALRRAALGVMGLAAAKVFLIDAAGLAGLMRVFSFLALGLSLAGLAWLNRWAGARVAEGSGTSGPRAAPPL